MVESVIPIHSDYQKRTINRLASKSDLIARIDAKCCSCVPSGHSEEAWRRQVDKCDSFLCPLFNVRPTLIGKRRRIEESE